MQEKRKVLVPARGLQCIQPIDDHRNSRHTGADQASPYCRIHPAAGIRKEQEPDQTDQAESYPGYEEDPDDEIDHQRAHRSSPPQNFA